MFVKIPSLANEVSERLVPTGPEPHLVVTKGEDGGVEIGVWIYDEESNQWLTQSLEVSATTLIRAIKAVLG